VTRSRRERPFGALSGCESEKGDKRIWHRIFRRVNRQLLAKGAASDLLKAEREVSNPWSMGKDGKTRLSASEQSRRMRK